MKRIHIFIILLVIFILLLIYLYKYQEGFDKTKMNTEFYQEDTNDYMEITNLMKIPPQLHVSNNSK